MTFDTTTDQHDIASLFRDIASSHVRPDAADTFHWHAWRALTDAGLWRLPVPVALGGAGKGWSAFTAAFEAIVSTLGSIGFAMALANQATLIRALLAHGTVAQRDTFLPRLLAGAPGATAISERGTGTEVRALQTTLRTHANGYRLDGHKYNISHAPDAALILVAAHCIDDGKARTALALLDPLTAGVTRTPPQATMGVRDLPVGDLEFDNVTIDRESVLGSPADGLARLMDIASMNRAYFGLLCADVVQPFLADALLYMRSRKTLDVALDSHQYVQRRLVDIRVGAERSRWMALAALDQLLAGHPSALANCSIAKLGAARDLSQAALDLLALHGSDGYRCGRLASFVADALAMGSAGGTEEMHRRNIFAQMQRHATIRVPAATAASATTAIAASPAPERQPA